MSVIRDRYLPGPGLPVRPSLLHLAGGSGSGWQASYRGVAAEGALMVGQGSPVLIAEKCGM